jgi:hypothetical protein
MEGAEGCPGERQKSKVKRQKCPKEFSIAFFWGTEAKRPPHNPAAGLKMKPKQ